MAFTNPRTWTTGETPTATILNTHLRDNLNYLSQPDDAWTTPTISGYTTASTTRAFAYRIINSNTVQLRGTLQKTGGYTATSTDVVTIASLAPPSGLYFAVASNDTGYGSRLQITTAGVIRVTVTTLTSTTFVSLEGVTWTIA